MPTQIPRIMQNPNNLYNIAAHSVKQKMPGRSHPGAAGSLSAELEMPGTKTRSSHLAGARPLGVFRDIG